MSSYADAVEKLNSLQSNAATLEAVRASGGRLSQFAIPEMVEYLQRIGYTPENLNALNVIHITGTKGKGSTSAFADSILRHLQPTWRVGLYTSPHLVAVRERIRINGVPISEKLFAKYFFEVWDRLQANTTRAHEDTSLMPGYFRFVTLLAFHVFLKENVDATILEVGVGGTYDSTNIVPKPVVAAVSALGIDHVSVLGKTIEDIAWQKGGIYKEGTPALSVPQPESAMNVLKSRAQELKASSFTVISPTPGMNEVKLGLAGEHQIENANLAINIVRHVARERNFASIVEDGAPLSQTEIEGLKATRWPGRCQQVDDPRREQLRWFLDGAHTVESLQCCFNWFVSPGVALPETTPSKSETPLRVLVFNCTHGRSGDSFLSVMLDVIKSQLARFSPQSTVANFFDHVIFCTNVTYADGHFKGDLTTVAIPEGELETLKTQNQLRTAWAARLPEFPESNIKVLPSIEHAVRTIEGLRQGDARPVQVMVSGSLHLVGGVIEAAGLGDVAL